MHSARTAIAGLIGASVMMVTSACYPPSQTPTTQTIPPGGRVVATGPVLTEMWIEDVTDDLSTILYAREDVLVSITEPVPYRFWVYDDRSGTTTEVPVGRAEYGTATLAPDGRSVVFSSNDPSLQVGPTAQNCVHQHGPWQPDTYHICGELYLFELDTGLTRQLTGLGGWSLTDNTSPRFTDDATAVDFVGATSADPSSWGRHRLDLATGVISLSPPAPPCCQWLRGNREITWDDATGGTLTSTDMTSGVVLTLWQDVDVFGLLASIDNGRFIVVSRWVTDQQQLFKLIDTDTGAARDVSSQWVSKDASRFAVVQRNVTPDATDRLIIARLAP
jgi:hypothetical protein